MKALLLALLASSTAAWAQGPVQADRKGCTESKLVSRMPGCVIVRCDAKDFTSLEIPRTQSERGHMVEGQYEFTTYRCPAGKSPVEIGRNTEAALKNAGYNILYTFVYVGGARFYMTARKGGQWVRFTAMGDSYDLIGVNEKEMEQVMTANAGDWAKAINQSGRVSVYGINFDTAKSSIRADSETALNEVVKLLQANPSWAMVVAGHTDNVGAGAMNLTLSRQRAQSVIAWLAAHGVAEARLVPAGFGDTRPVAENTSDEGRRKNRRVDLVKLYD